MFFCSFWLSKDCVHAGVRRWDARELGLRVGGCFYYTRSNIKGRTWYNNKVECAPQAPYRKVQVEVVQLRSSGQLLLGAQVCKEGELLRFDAVLVEEIGTLEGGVEGLLTKVAARGGGDDRVLEVFLGVCWGCGWGGACSAKPRRTVWL